MTIIPLGTDATTADVVVNCDAPDYAIVITLSNQSSAHQVFKLKTNAPRRWSVRPNGGILAPGATAIVSIKVIRRATDSMLIGIQDDRHLIVSAPVSADDATVLRNQREQQPRISQLRPDADEPGASCTHVTPRFASLPPHSPGATSVGTATPPLSASGAMLSPATPSLASTPVDATTLASPPVDANSHGSVADKVAAIEVSFPAMPQEQLSAASSGRQQFARDNEGSDDGSSPPWLGRDGLLRKLLSCLAAVGDEFTPWLSCVDPVDCFAALLCSPPHRLVSRLTTLVRPCLRSWKAYDMLFAILMLYLGRRFERVKRARELLDV